MGSKPDNFNITRQHSVQADYYFLKIMLTSFFFSEKYSLGIKIKIKPILKVILLRILLFKFIETKKGKKNRQFTESNLTTGHLVNYEAYESLADGVKNLIKLMCFYPQIPKKVT